MNITNVKDVFANLLVRLTPKKNICVLRGKPSYEDNLIAIYEELKVRKFDKIIWITDEINIKPPIELTDHTVFIKRRSVKDFFYSIIAKHIFVTHGHFVKTIPKNQVCINLWHGIPYKAIGVLDEKPGRNDTWFVATSKVTQDLFAQCFNISTSKIIVTGQARTDRFHIRDPKVIWKKLSLSVKNPAKLFVWLPTYRVTQRSGGRLDGIEYDNVFNCTNFNIKKFNDLLCSANSICLVKAHPMSLPLETKNYSNIVYINDLWLWERGLTLYQVCAVTDCLISDLSSIIVDYMLLDRPIVILFEDLIEYRESRGFTFNPIEDWLPSKVAKDFDSFVVEIEKVLRGEDEYRNHRNQIRERFFSHQDHNSAKRIVEFLFQ